MEYKLLRDYLDQFSLYYKIDIYTLRKLEHLYGYVLCVTEKQLELWKREDLIVQDVQMDIFDLLDKCIVDGQIDYYFVLDDKTRVIIDYYPVYEDKFIKSYIDDDSYYIPLIIL